MFNCWTIIHVKFGTRMPEKDAPCPSLKEQLRPFRLSAPTVNRIFHYRVGFGESPRQKKERERGNNNDY